jgi:hypothetical protein
MGRTTDELDWCFQLLHQNYERFPTLRLALCGPEPDVHVGQPEVVRSRIDHLGSLPPTKIPTFAAAINLGLLPLESNPFNESRFPIKFAEYMMGSAPVLCSEVGECFTLGAKMPWVVPGGNLRAHWLVAGAAAIEKICTGMLPAVDLNCVSEILEWKNIGAGLLEVYYRSLFNSHETASLPAPICS